MHTVLSGFFFFLQPPVIVSNPEGFALDLYSSNKHLFHSQLMCWIVGQLNALWHMRHSLAVDTGGSIEGEKERLLAWRPWEHIQPHPKGTPAPQINLSGKYCVRLYWMVCGHYLALTYCNCHYFDVGLLAESDY